MFSAWSHFALLAGFVRGLAPTGSDSLVGGTVNNTNCSISLSSRRQADDGWPLPNRMELAHALAAEEKHQKAAETWAEILASKELPNWGGEAEAAVWFNLAQALLELKFCGSEASSAYRKAAEAYKRLETSKEAKKKKEQRKAHRLNHGKALMGAASAERILCSGGRIGSGKVAERSHCEEAKKLIKRAQGFMPGDPRPLVNEGNVLMHLSEPVGAANAYLAAARINPELVHHAHPMVKEFLLTRVEFEGGADVQDLMEIAWIYSKPRLSMNADCTLNDTKSSSAVLVNHCSWIDFKDKNPTRAEQLTVSMQLAWELRAKGFLDDDDD
eukprot:gnl/TRDRNA2_/TRDRNA2_114057_c0_seq1.p1 gnl/TRDRNA2_/TRDRNA2_114057_c0~~gnl/TRDRNA2_/TRDRNA2_114057_c0_seq1.p1  ORF type:complete len:328 (+),score=70.98 gnl/TRDRNA2_/TRDRNA2_114057_c0_seq1:111-1094(+)